MDESRLELKVGALMLAAVVGTLGLLYAMGELSFSSGRTVVVDFSHTGNVVKGAPVKLGGVVVGRVDAVELLADRRDSRGDPMPVRMTVSISEDTEKALRTDAAITVSSQGPLGEPYLEIWPGSAAQIHLASAPIRGVDAPRIDIVSNRLAKFLDSASKVLETDPEAVSKLVNGFGGLTTTVDGVLTENRTQIHDLAQELSVAAKDLRLLAAIARKELEPGGRTTVMIDDAAAAARVARTDLPELSKKASTALGGLAAVSGQFTEEDGQRLKAMLVKYQQAGEKVDALASRADMLMKKLEAGDGTLGALAKDKQVYDDLKSLLADLRKHPWKMLWKE
jgi:phospholipid/cholesterol/gamma-HCH transport system substrate-binding protein